jgi:NAD-dependent dihydropyrimidine dehydrogenase PreA subunit
MMNVVAVFRDVVETMFRFFPFPTRTGLRVFGQPGPEAPVLLTCNFDLTVRRVTKALEGLDCYLLVAPSKGINVWCAAGGGHLNAYSVTSVIKTSCIGEQVSHRTLILPQLAAPGVDVARVEEETGWLCRFGPVYARDIAEYLDARLEKTDVMCRARFDLRDRLEMAVMWATPMSVLAGIPVAIVSPRDLLGTLALIWAFTLFVYALYEPIMRYVPGPTGLAKTLFLGLAGVGAVLALGLGLADWGAGAIIGWGLALLVVALVLGFDMDGTSPLRAGSTVAYWGRKWPGTLRLWDRMGLHLDPFFSLRVDEGKCRGCGTCVDVCPTGVFEVYDQDGQPKAKVVRLARCEQCTACVKQCPSGAVLADPEIRTFQE